MPLINSLEHLGFKIGIDKDQIYFGSNIPETLFKEIDTASYLVFVLSPNFLKTRFCMRELSYSLDQKSGSKVLPLVYDLEYDEIISREPRLKGVSYEQVILVEGKLINLDRVVLKIMQLYARWVIPESIPDWPVIINNISVSEDRYLKNALFLINDYHLKPQEGPANQIIRVGNILDFVLAGIHDSLDVHFESKESLLRSGLIPKYLAILIRYSSSKVLKDIILEKRNYENLTGEISKKPFWSNQYQKSVLLRNILKLTDQILRFLIHRYNDFHRVS